MPTPKNSIHSVDIGRIGRLLVSPNWSVSRQSIAADGRNATTDLAREGMVILRGLIRSSLCERTVSDYSAYENRMLEAGVKLRDHQQRNYRLTNFHLESANALEIGCTERIHEILDEYFGLRSMVYTSLYYKYGSQQATHLDTPFFVTRPIGWFAGVWIALEDVQPDAGPVEYFPGSHRLFDSVDKLQALKDPKTDLDHFFQRVRSEALSVTSPVEALLKKGDVLIWHHALPHSGTIARNPALTRHSMVFHMGAEGVNIRQDKLFDKGAFLDLPRYGTFKNGSRKVARVGLPALMF
jgi:ectoine hydroxylase-related dioxygenase (phytanoyl-CoA dioxygenase family)